MLTRTVRDIKRDVSDFMSQNRETLTPSTYNALERGSLPVGKPIQVSDSTPATGAVMHKNNSHLIKCHQFLLTKMVRTDKPTTPEAVYQELADYLSWVELNKVPVTYGAFALWLGWTDTAVDKSIRRGGSMGVAFEQCKRMIHTILEQAAIDGELNVLMYFHMNKGYFGMVEKQEITHRLEDNSSELTAEDTDAKLNALPTNLL